MPFSTLISTDQLSALLGDPTIVIVDCRFTLDDLEWGRREYAAGHIPGAVYAHLDEDLAGEKNGRNGRHPLPAPETFARTVARLGVSNGTQVVAYDQDSGMYASRLWWMLRWLGHESVAVLDGGILRWIAEGRPTVSGVEQRAPGTFSGTPRAEVAATTHDVATLLGRSDRRLLDARAPERFRGDVEPLDRVAGHIPGAANHFYKNNLTPDGTFRSPDELRRQFDDALAGVPADHVVAYCGSGVTACHNLLALEHAGLHGARLYAGSWSEWSSDPSRPVAVGNSP